MDTKTPMCSLLEEMAPNMPASLRRLCSNGYMFKATQHLLACGNQHRIFKAIQPSWAKRAASVLLHTTSLVT